MTKQLCAFLFAIFLICPANLLAKAVYPVIPLALAKNAPVGVPSPEVVRTFVLATSRAYGVNPRLADWIADKESQFNPNAIGDGGRSVGLWQFNLEANPEVLRSCALDYRCSTKLAMEWIIAGKSMAWSTYSMCRNWYPDCPF